MKIVNDVKTLRELVNSWRKEGLTVGFVPTMGYLHQGHLSLVKLAATKSDKTIVSIFVNPTQFNDPNDFKKYPIDLPRDYSLLETAGTDAVFVPNAEMIYGDNFQSWVELKELPLGFEGASRPGHFKGVSTVVTILFNLVKPDFAVFGEKDFQQLRIVETMVRDLKLDMAIVRGPIVREKDGLAMSSRNVRLSPDARKIAPQIFNALSLAREAAAGGETSSKKIEEVAVKHLSKFPEITIDYLTTVNEGDLTASSSAAKGKRILFAGFLDNVRLLDNMAL